MSHPILLIKTGSSLIPLLKVRNTMKIKETNSLPPRIHMILTTQGIAISTTSDIEAVMKHRKQLRHHFIIVDTRQCALEDVFHNQIRLSKRGYRLLLARDENEIVILIEKIQHEFSKFKIAKSLDEHFIRQCTPENIKLIFYKLPVSSTEAEILMETYGNILKLSQASADDIMRKTPLSQQSATIIEDFFSKRRMA